MARLADYIDFENSQGREPDPPVRPAAAASGLQPASEASGSPTAHLKRGMTMSEVTNLLGEGKQLSESVSSDGLKTQVFEYLTKDRRAEITYVDGLVVRFLIGSR